MPASIAGLPALNVPVGFSAPGCRWACSSSAPAAAILPSCSSARPITRRPTGPAAIHRASIHRRCEHAGGTPPENMTAPMTACHGLFPQRFRMVRQSHRSRSQLCRSLCLPRLRRLRSDEFRFRTGPARHSRGAGTFYRPRALRRCRKGPRVGASAAHCSQQKQLLQQGHDFLERHQCGGENGERQERGCRYGQDGRPAHEERRLLASGVVLL